MILAWKTTFQFANNKKKQCLFGIPLKPRRACLGISSIIKGFLPKLIPVQKIVPESRHSIADRSFSTFFHADSVGDALFHLLRPYLCVWESGVTGGEDKSELFTIGDVLATRDDTVASQTDRIPIGKEASKAILTHKGGCSMAATRPHRVVDVLGDRWRWVKLFHPAERPQVEELVEW